MILFLFLPLELLLGPDHDLKTCSAILHIQTSKSHNFQLSEIHITSSFLSQACKAQQRRQGWLAWDTLLCCFFFGVIYVPLQYLLVYEPTCQRNYNGLFTALLIAKLSKCTYVPTYLLTYIPLNLRTYIIYVHSLVLSTHLCTVPASPRTYVPIMYDSLLY